MTENAFSDLLALGTGPELNINENETFVDAFLRQVERIPDAIAVVDEFSSITYGELNRKSDIFASSLIGKGIQTGDFVAIKLPRVKEFLVAVIGIWKAGAAYVPIDPAYPKERIEYMLEDSGAKFVIDDTWLESLRKPIEEEQPHSICRAEAEGTALLMYTSGSTGVPKGVVVPHIAIICMCVSGTAVYRQWMGERYKIAEIIPFSYIYSCRNLYRSLTDGCELHLLPTRMAKNLEELDRYIRDNGVKIMNTIPQMALTLIDSFHTPLDIIGIGGSRIKMPGSGMTRVLAGYSLTETCGGVTYMMVSERSNGKSIIGRPSAGTIVMLEDEDGVPVPYGEIGEICISSRGLAGGYLHDEAKTREVFVDRPWSKYKVVRTGDFGRWNEDNVLEFHGRKDDMVKIGGNRVELGEVDVALSRIEGVNGAASALKIINGEAMLCGYYVSEEAIPETLLRSSLSEHLPSYMIPSLFVRLDSLPHLPNGKLDRLSLPIPEITVREDIVAPQTEFEKQVFGVVSSELGTDNFGVTTDLVSLGLTSLRAIRLSVALKRESGLYIPQSAILAHPTIREWEKISAAESDSIAIEAPRKHYPLTDNQMGVYIEWERGKQSDQYNNPFLLKIDGGNAERLLDSVGNAIDNHPVLKTHLAKLDGRIVQLRRDDAVLNVCFQKLDFEPDEAFFGNFVRPFNLLDDDLARFTVYSSPNAAWLFFDVHHIIFDGGSINLFFKTLSSLYRGIEPEPEPVNAYDYALYRERWKETDEFRECERYFESLLEGTEPYTHPSLSGKKAEKRLGAEVLTLPREAVKSLCRKCGITENSFFAAVLAQVFHRFCREENIQIAMFSSGRSMTQLAGSIGMFVQTLPLVSRITEGTVFDALKYAHSQIIGTLSRDKYPYTVLTEKYGVRPNVMYIYQGDLIEKPDFGAVPVEYKRLPVSCAISPLSVEIIPDEEKYTIRFEYNGSLYGADEIKVLAKAFANMARGMSASKAGTLLRDIGIVDEQERQELLRLGTGETLDYDHSETFVDMFLRSVAQHPDSAAAVDYRSSLTYRELDELSDAFAHRLLEEGVKPDDFVAITLPRVKEFVAAAIGIWKAGAAYVPIDSGYPEERRRFILEDSCAKVLIDESFCDGITPTGCSPVNRATPDGLAYMIYTSGSSGRPKGVMIQHMALTCFVNFIRNEWHLEPDSHISCHSNYAFDASVEDLYSVLTAGGTLFLPSEKTCLDLEELICYLRSNKITGGCYTTQIGQILAASYPDIPLNYLNLGGEEMTLAPKCSYRLINTYGPTELTVECTFSVIASSNDFTRIPIGRPLHNLYAFVCDYDAHLVPKGMPGELCMAGPQLAKGYWKQPELTAEKFVDCPYLPGRKMYKTGDLARWNEEGELEFLGRIDNQVKLRGFRIEPGEIEAAILKIDGIRSAVAQVRDINGSQHLCAYYVSASEKDEPALKLELSKSLPGYMVPDAFTRLEALPLTPNGKVDRNALPEPEMRADEIIAPETERERLLFNVVADELGTDRFGVTTNLLSMGLTSIRAIRLSLAISQRLGIHINTADILAGPRIRDWKENESVRIETAETREFYPLTDNQLGIFIDCERNHKALQYNVPTALKLTGVEAPAVVSAIKKVFAAHPSLKTRLVSIDGKVMQQRRDGAQVRITCRRMDSIPPSEEFFQSRVRPFNLLEDDLARFEVYYNDAATYLFIDIHHIIYDGSAVNILLSDIARALSGGCIKKESVTSYDYALYYDEWKRSKEYSENGEYFDRLVSDTEPFRYPASREGTSSDGKSATIAVSVSIGGIRDYCRRLGVTEYTFFATVLTQVFHKISREDSIQIVTASNGRSMEQLSGTTGMFVQTLPLVSRKSKGMASELLRQMQKQIIETIRHDKYPFTALVEKHGVKPNVMYVFQGDVIDTDLFDASWNAEVLPLHPDTVKMPISINVIPDEDRYSITIEYDAGLYSESDMTTLGRALSTFAAALAEEPEDTDVSTMGLTDGQEAETLIQLGTGEELDYDRSETFVDMFLRSVKLCPDATAVADKDGGITYRELDGQSNALAHWLIEEKGVRPDDFVAVEMPRVKEFVVAVIGIWKAGAAYVPIDPEYPEERRRYMIEDSEAKAVITSAAFNELRSNRPVNRAAPDGSAYMIYTSGSTGRPKGVVLGHSGLVNYIRSTARINGLRRGDRISAHRSFSFDSHIEEFYPTLFAGGTVYVMPEETRKDLDNIYKFIVDNKIDGCYFTTSMAVLLYRNYDLPVRFIGAVGEKLSGVVGGRNGVLFLNTYGPTECTDHISAFPLEEGRTYRNIPIGRPLHNGTVLITDAGGRLVPRGMAGELCFVSPQLAKGYWKQPELTAEKFVDCPYLPGRKMYKTGDLARWNEEGELEFLGRIDNQVKLRGFRIEPGEIEAAILKIDGIRSAVAQVRDINGSQHLCAYYVSDSEKDEPALKLELSKSLPGYMVPDAFVRLDTMPLSPNGKIDRKHIPEVCLPHTEKIDPSNEREQIFFDKVKELLGTDSFGVTDDLTRFGMNSIRAMKLAVGLPKEWGIKVSDVIGSRTIRGILREKHDVAWFYKEYDSSKKTIVVVHGLAGAAELSALEDELSERFNVLKIEHISATLLSKDNIDKLVSRDGYNEFVLLYSRRIRELLPEDSVLSLVLGFSIGGSMAYDIACEWNLMTGQKPVVVMGDSYLFLASEEEGEPVRTYTPEQWRERIRKANEGVVNFGECWKELHYTIRRNRKTIRRYDGKVIMLRATHGPQLNELVKSRLKDGLLSKIARWIYWHLHIRDLAISRKSPKLNVEYRHQSQDNISAWKRFCPEMKIIDVDSTHVGLSCDRSLIPRYLRLIGREME